MAVLASDWLIHFRLLLWNQWTEFNETWQEARFQRPLPSLWFFGPIGKKDGRPGLWLAETFLTSTMKPLNEIWWNLTGSKTQCPLPRLWFFGPIGKTRWPSWPLICWDIFDFSSETAQRNSNKLDRKQDLNVLYQIRVFRADQLTKIVALADSSKRWHIVLRCTICGPLGLLFLLIILIQSFVLMIDTWYLDSDLKFFPCAHACILQPNFKVKINILRLFDSFW